MISVLTNRIRIIPALFLVLSLAISAQAHGQAGSASQVAGESGGHVAVIAVDQMILPGTSMYIEESIAEAARNKAGAFVIELNTPGGLLQSAQEIIQHISSAPLPVFVYVTPTGSAAISAGVLVVQAAHVAAMAPGTSIGAAHPVSQDGKDIEGDMRAKAENATVAMVTAIAGERGRNQEWVAESVRKSSSITDTEAVQINVIDIGARDIQELLKKAAGREVSIAGTKTMIGDLSGAPIRRMEFPLRHQIINAVAHPTVIALLWLLATSGLSIELYNPGLIIPGVVGAISLILALAMSQVIPINQGAVLLMVAGAALIGAEIFTGSLVLGVGGLVALCLGALYIIDTTQAPGFGVPWTQVLPTALIFGGILLASSLSLYHSLRRKVSSGKDALIGLHGKALESFAELGSISIQGEIWKARPAHGLITKGQKVRVTRALDGLCLEVTPEGE
jgi:membrane-bound serine protease (ClpP class)